MRKFLFWATIGCLSFSSIQAAPISRAEAEAIAGRYITVERGAELRSKRVGNAEAMPYYLFNAAHEQGFAIIAGDDRITPLLGYSDRGSIDAANMPSALVAWLDEVAAAVASMPETSERAAELKEATPVVDALVKTNWYQLTPYNDKCPAPDVYTCCVATAMAQIMNYHRWPEQGIGSITYESYYGLNDSDDPNTAGVISHDFSKSTYDWENMLPTYTLVDGKPNWNDAQKDAVATLMRDCGYAARVQYTTHESIAYDADAAAGLTEHLGYDAHLYPHYKYSTSEWMGILKNELDNGFPVLFTGQAPLASNATGGHAFVVDGYDSNSFLHINWGWNGEADGFYNLCYMVPTTRPTIFYSCMQIFTTIHPRKPFSSAVYNMPLVCLYDIGHKGIEYSGLDVENSGVAVDINESQKVKMHGAALCSSRKFEGNIALMLASQDGKYIKSLSSQSVLQKELSSEYKDMDIKVSDFEIPAGALSGIADGDYKILPVSEYKNPVTGELMEPQTIAVYGYKKWLNLTIKEGKATFTNIIYNTTKVKIPKEIEVPDKIAYFKNYTINIPIENTSDMPVEGRLNCSIVSSDGKNTINVGHSYFVVYENMSIDVPITFSINDTRYLAGEYSFAFDLEKSEGNTLDYAFESPKTTLYADTENTPSVVIKGVSITDIDSEDDIPLDNFVYDLETMFGYELKIDFDVEGCDVRPLSITLASTINDKVINEQAVYNTYFEWTQSLLLHKDIFDASGKAMLKLCYRDIFSNELKPMTPADKNTIEIKLKSGTGVDGISATEAVEVARYNAQGVRLNTPAPGINLVKMSDGTVKKVIVK